MLARSLASKIEIASADREESPAIYFLREILYRQLGYRTKSSYQLEMNRFQLETYNTDKTAINYTLD